MGLTTTQIAKLQTMKEAAKNALRYFKEIKPIKSDNNPFAFTAAKESAKLQLYRDDQKKNGMQSIAQDMEDASLYRVGNCGEKASIVYSFLTGNPVLHNKNLYVTRCQTIGYNHAFVVISDEQISTKVNLKELGGDTMIVDGWTEDWYFPHLPWTTAKWYGISNLPNPRQLYVRHQIASYPIEADDRLFSPSNDRTIYVRDKVELQPNYKGKDRRIEAIGDARRKVYDMSSQMRREEREFDDLIAKGQAPFQKRAAQQQAGDAPSTPLGSKPGRKPDAFIWVPEKDQWSPSKDLENWMPSSSTASAGENKAANWNPKSNIRTWSPSSAANPKTR